MTKEELFENIQRKRSFLCVGLDSDVDKIPQHLFDEKEDPIFRFNKGIIDATAKHCVAYKLNLAFYEDAGEEGMNVLERTVDYIRRYYSDQFVIADAKRGDIGNTSEMYAHTFLNNFRFDAVTVAPYMGSDSVTPFLSYENKWAIVLALTSNKGAMDFQLMKDQETGEQLFERVLRVSREWGSDQNMMYVVGATRAEMLKDVRAIVPDHFLLVPGVGAQGGSLAEVAKYGLNSTCGLLVNSSRQIIFASPGIDFGTIAQREAQKIQLEMDQILIQAKLIK